eukprot:g10155.t1
MEPHWWRYLILPTLLAVARPCRREDVHYDFTECHQGPALDGGPVREAFAYVDRESCNLRDNHSVRLPPPLLDLPCEQPCGANRFLQLKETTRRRMVRSSRDQMLTVVVVNGVMGV